MLRCNTECGDADVGDWLQYLQLGIYVSKVLFVYLPIAIVLLFQLDDVHINVAKLGHSACLETLGLSVEGHCISVDGDDTLSVMLIIYTFLGGARRGTRTGIQTELDVLRSCAHQS